MLQKEIINEIQTLLHSRQWSQRQIARKIGVSRTAVRNVLKKMADRPRFQGIVEPTGKPRRCPDCGGWVLMPCLACQIRALPRKKRRSEPP